MKNKIIILAAVLLSTLCAWGQASTEGKDFWVGSTIVCSPSGAGKKASPYIAISTEKACQVNIDFADGTNFVTGAQLQPGTWNTFTPTLAKWYPQTASDASAIYQLAGQTNNYGLHITATENVSVYVVLRAEYSMDASNILPVTALQSEYFTQDYWPTANDFSNLVSMATILATEDNTVVDITPRAGNAKPTGWGATEMQRTITLNKGQTYYLMSASEQMMSGTHIQARSGKKIAIFNGSPLTRVPAGVSARDCLFEQSMPVDYWGTNFIVTRSMDKDANIVAVTAWQEGTIVKIDGVYRATLASGETYYFELDSNNDPYTKNKSKVGDYALPADHMFTKEAVYVETSCPVSVLSFDVGNSYKGKDSDVSGDGDPSSVLIAPIEQRIMRITFGACYTDKTRKHCLDVVATTASCQNTVLTAYKNNRAINKSALLVWKPVPGNPAYSYAQAIISEEDEAQSVFTLENTEGVIAHIYGNGEDESYAYSVGSSAVKRGIQLNELILTDSVRTDVTYCAGTTLHFNAQVGSDVIDRAQWIMGDGITYTDGRIAFDHTYDSPGWYDVYTTVWAHKDCPDTVYPAEQIHVAFRIIVPETIRVDTSCYDEDLPLVYEGKQYMETTNDTTESPDACDWIKIFHMEVLPTCLELEALPNAASVCGDTTESVHFPYYRKRGKFSSRPDTLVVGAKRYLLTREAENNRYGEWTLPLDSLRPGHYRDAVIHVADTACGRVHMIAVPFDVLYPSEVFTQKWEDVMVVYNEANNGGYAFKAYQWYYNGAPIPGATEAYYYVGPDATLPAGAYQVLLTDVNGQTLLSCPIQVEGTLPEAGSLEQAAAPYKIGIMLSPGVLMLQVGERQVLVQ